MGGATNPWRGRRDGDGPHGAHGVAEASVQVGFSGSPPGIAGGVSGQPRRVGPRHSTRLRRVKLHLRNALTGHFRGAYGVPDTETREGPGGGSAPPTLRLAALCLGGDSPTS